MMREAQEEYAVRIRKAFKSYGSGSNRHVVLNNLDMNVPKGSIYGLLGASGCGKTTLLSCIVGRKHIQSGEIFSLGGTPGSRESGIPGPRVGYMPQEVGIYGEFTIWETLKFFGWINGMTTEEIEEKAKFLLDLMGFSNRDVFVKNLSGGQQRRVSMMATFIHSPELLILDEPTVGLDPILRERIWEHLVEMTRVHKTTIIITTHYIDEAKQASIIGMMRKGILLAEESPTDLAQRHGLESLEDVFLKLSYEQNTSRNSITEAQPVIHSQPVFDEIKAAEKTQLFSLSGLVKSHHLKALVWKNALWMRRNLGMLWYILLLPVLQLVLFFHGIGHDAEGLNVAILNRESPQNVLCPYNMTFCNHENISCRFLHHFARRKHNLVAYQNYEEALEAVERGWAWTLIDIPANFSQNMVERLELGRLAEDSALEGSEFTITMDMSNKQIARMIQRDLYASLSDLADDMAISCDIPRGILASPIAMKEPIYGNVVPHFNAFMAPGMLLTISFFLSVLTTSGSLLYERNEGIFERTLVTGITGFEILIGCVMTQVVILVGVCFYMILLSVYVYNVENYGSVFLMYVLTLTSGICGMSFGFIVSCVCSKDQTAMYVSMGSFLPFIELCGICWPIEGMERNLRKITPFLPLTFPTDSLRAVMGRGWDITNPTVYFGLVSNFVWSVIFLSISIGVIKFKKS